MKDKGTGVTHSLCNSCCRGEKLSPAIQLSTWTVAICSKRKRYRQEKRGKKHQDACSLLCSWCPTFWSRGDGTFIAAVVNERSALLGGGTDLLWTLAQKKLVWEEACLDLKLSQFPGPEPGELDSSVPLYLSTAVTTSTICLAYTHTSSTTHTFYFCVITCSHTCAVL